MRVGNYSVIVEGANERESERVVVGTADGGCSVKLISHSGKRCDVELTIGTRSAVYRVDPHGCVVVGRDVDDRVVVPGGGTNLVARFRPEYEWRRPDAVRVEVDLPPAGVPILDADGHHAPPIDHDPQGETVIRMRLATTPVRASA